MGHTKKCEETESFLYLKKRVNEERYKITYLKSSSAKEWKIKAGRAKVPTKVLSPFASNGEMMLVFPAMYLNVDFVKSEEKEQVNIRRSPEK
jgi:hypothetical protein